MISFLKPVSWPGVLRRVSALPDLFSKLGPLVSVRGLNSEGMLGYSGCTALVQESAVIWEAIPDETIWFPNW